MDLTAGIFIVASDSSKPRLIINLGQNKEILDENQITIEINSKIDDHILFNIVDALNSSISSIKYKWEVCSLTGEILEDNIDKINNKLTRPLLVEILGKFLVNQEELKINYYFSISKAQFVKKSVTSISTDEGNIITIIKGRTTRSIQSGTLKKDRKFKNYQKNEILKILRLMVEKRILVRSGSWFLLKED